MTFFKTTFLSKYWIRSSQIAGISPNNTKKKLGGKPLPPFISDRYFSDQVLSKFVFLSRPLEVPPPQPS